MSSGFIFQPLLGKLLDFFRNGMVTDSGAPLYTVEMYRSAFQALIASMAIAIVSACFINDMKNED
jgi:hypothetical protein